METLQELVQFLHPSQRLDLKAVATMDVLGLTGTTEGKEVIFKVKEVVRSLFLLTEDPSESVAKDAVLALINLTAEEEDAKLVYAEATQMVCIQIKTKLFLILKLFQRFNLTSKAVAKITDENSPLADPWAMVLSNLTRVEHLVGHILTELDKDDKSILSLVKAFSKIDYNKKGCKLNYLGPIFCNLTQTSRGRELVCKSKYNLLDRLIPFTNYEESIVRRGGTVGILKNICFDPVYHETMLSEEKDDILFAVLYPLAGPEEFTDEENEKFPLELQYLGEDKKREEDDDLRIMLLESLLQLCAKQKYREILRNKGVYEILREYHKWEAKEGLNKNALLACENVVDILIKKEDEIGLDNYRELDVPEHLSKQFVEDDLDFVTN